MFKLFKYFKPYQWVLTVLLFAFLVIQCYCDVTLPGYTSELITKMQTGHDTASIMSTGYVMLAYAGVSIACTIVVTFIAYYLSTSHAKRLRNEIYNKVESFSMQEMSRFSTPSLITRSTNDVQQVSSATMLFLRIGFAAPLTAVLALLKINSASYEMTVAVTIGVSVLIAGILTILFFVGPKFKLIQRLTDKINGITRENLTGIRIIKAFNAEGYQKEKFDKTNTEYTKTNIFANRIMGFTQPLITLVNYALTLTIYWLGCYLIIRNNDPTFFATMFSFTQLVSQVIMAFMMMVMVILMLPRAQVSAGRINEVLIVMPDITDPASPKTMTTKGAIEFKNVSFRYHDASTDALSNISFTATPGETVAFIGATGSGKTTLINLIPRFFDITSGEVLVGGENVRDLSQADLRGAIGYVPQKSLLFSGTVQDNIAFGNENLPIDKVQKCAEIACAAEFIENLDEKYLAPISQGGKNLSGGQKQRLSIARAVAADPDIYIFDDSFSALDFKTDADVRKNIAEHAADVTKIIVAQRVGTIKNADKIIVLENGRMIGCGTHKELLSSCEEYREIAYSQMSEEEAA